MKKYKSFFSHGEQSEVDIQESLIILLIFILAPCSVLFPSVTLFSVFGTESKSVDVFLGMFAQE